MKRGLTIIGFILLLAILWLLFAPTASRLAEDVPADCLPGETFDTEDRICYFDFYCETNAECEAVDARYGELLDALGDSYVLDERDHAAYGSDIDRAVIRGTEEQVGAIQTLVDDLISPGHRSYISAIVSESDGFDGTLAYVEPTDDQGDSWTIAYDPEDTFTETGVFRDKEEFIATLIHEYAHILTLNSSQVDHASSDVEFIECYRGYTIVDEGCAKPGSYVTQFVREFWNEEDRDEAYEAFAREKEEDFAYELFEARPDDFVTEYAATNEVEDIAESFTLFVMQGRSEENTMAEQKINFFYTYPELVALRSHIRGGVLQALDQE